MNVHTLRHSAASAMLVGGVPLLTVSRMLGHSSVSITGDIDGHITDDGGKQAAAALANALEPAASQANVQQPVQQRAGKHVYMKGRQRRTFMDAKCVATRGDARNPWTSADPRERLAPGWGSRSRRFKSCQPDVNALVRGGFGGIRNRLVGAQEPRAATRFRGQQGSDTRTTRARRSHPGRQRQPESAWQEGLPRISSTPFPRTARSTQVAGLRRRPTRLTPGEAESVLPGGSASVA